MSTTNNVTNPLISEPDQNQSNDVENNFTTLENMFRFALGIVLNTGILAAAVVVLIMSKNEAPEVPLRLWIVVYAVLCCVQIFISGFLYLGRRGWNLAVDDITDTGKLIITISIIFYYIWFLIGLYWVIFGGQMLADHATKLYWLSVVFLAIDTVSIVINIGVACFRRISRGRANNSLDDPNSAERIARRRKVKIMIATFSIVLNAVSAVASVVVLLISMNEDPQISLRMWIVLYALLCICNIFTALTNDLPTSNHNDNNDCISANTKILVIYVIWWLYGLYWVVTGQMLAENAPKLYWLSVIFMTKELIYFVIIGVSLFWLACLFALRYCSGGNAN